MEFREYLGPFLFFFCPLVPAFGQLCPASGKCFHKSLTAFQLGRLKSRTQPFGLRAASPAFRSFPALLLASLPILPALFCQTFKVLAELGLLAVHVLDSLSLQTQPKLFNALAGALDDMEAVTHDGGSWECFPHDGTHTVRQIHRDSADLQTPLCRNLQQHRCDILRIDPPDDGNDGTIPAVCILVVYNRIEFMTERCLVYADTRSDVPRLQHPLPGMVFLLPGGEAAKRVLVGTLEGVGVNHVSPAQALGRHRLTVHPTSLKKAPALSSMTFPRRQSLRHQPMGR